MGVVLDLLGKRFGKLLVIQRKENSRHKEAMWLCKCDCGGEKVAYGMRLKSGMTDNCGCASKKKTHGLSTTLFYHLWGSMHQRCKAQPSYAGRGIYVCERWKSYENFHEDMWPSYVIGLQIDRIDNDGPYSPENCRWATRTENSRNKRSNHLVSYKGRMMTLMEASELSGVKKWCLISRANAGLTESTGLFFLGYLTRDKKELA